MAEQAQQSVPQPAVEDPQDKPAIGHSGETLTAGASIEDLLATPAATPAEPVEIPGDAGRSLATIVEDQKAAASQAAPEPAIRPTGASSADGPLATMTTLRPTQWGNHSGAPW